MTITLTHTFVSTIPDGVDTTVVRPSDWNASHTVSGTVPVANGGTDASTAAAARVNLLPSYTGNASKRLTINAGATDVEWVADGGGTVTSVAFSTGTTGLSVSGSPITSSGTFTLSGTLAVANGGTGATTAATARSNLGAAASGANTDITSLAALTGIIESPVLFDWDTTGGQTGGILGRMKWNSTDLTLDIGVSDGTVTLQVGQENVTPARNNTGTTIADFMVVRLTGSQAQRATIALAQADSAANVTNVYGITTQDIANNATGFVTTYGLVRNVDTSAFTEGATLYLSAATAGALTATAPVSPNFRVPVAVCVRSHASMGSILVLVEPPTSLDSLTGDTLIIAPATGDILGRNGASLWVNQAATGSGSPVRGTAPALSAPTYALSATVTAGTNAQGQGALTSDLNVITTAASSPSGVTLPAGTAGRRLVVINRGANTINIYPASGGTIDALSTNAAIAVPATGWMEFIATTSTQWYSTANMATTALWS